MPSGTDHPNDPPDLVGTWVGTYQYPMTDADGSPRVIDATETLVITHQQGGMVWGDDQYEQNGQVIHDPVRGSFDTSGTEVTITEDGGFFRGHLTPEGRLLVRFTRTDDLFTSFEVTLTRR